MMFLAAERKHRPGRHRAWLTYALSLALLLGVLVLAWVMVERSVGRYEAELEGDLRGEALLRVEAHAQFAKRMFDHVGYIHLFAAEAFRGRAPGNADRFAFIEQHLRFLATQERGGVFEVSTIDAAGRVAWSTTGAGTGHDLSDSEPFRLHAQGHLPAFVSAPLDGRAAGRERIQLTRPIIEREGGFTGVSVVSVDPTKISNDLGLVPMRRRGRVMLVRDDGLILVTSDTQDGLAGRQLSQMDVNRIVTQPYGTGFLTDSPTREKHIAAWKQIDNWPVFVVHSLPRNIARETAEARGQTDRQALLSLILGVWGVASAAVMWYHAHSTRENAQLAELAHAETEQTLEALPGAAYRVDFGRAGPIDWRPAASAVFSIVGIKPTASPMEDAFETMTDDEGKAARAEFLRRLADEGEAVAEYNLLIPGGAIKRLREHARVLEVSLEPNRFIVGMLTDITAERELEAQILTSARLASLGDMASGIAHEVNQPATAIALAADLAMLQLDRMSIDRSVPLYGTLENIAGQAIRLRSVISHFRAFSRPDQDREPLHFKRLHIAIDGARRIIDGILDAAGISLRVTLPNDLPLVQYRPVPLEQVLVNLAINCRDAILANPHAARLIDITAHAHPDKDEVTLRVTDYAGGFPPDVLPHVLEPFFTTKGPEHGTGLGLSIAYTTMKSFRGCLSIRNHRNGGAEVSLTFRCSSRIELANVEA